MVWNNSVFPLLIVNAGGGFTGLFIYSPIPGSGNLLSSSAAQSGTDPYGNHYIGPGYSVYNNGAGLALQMSGAALQFYTGSLAAGWTPGSVIITTDVGQDLIENAAGNVLLTAGSGLLHPTTLEVVSGGGGQITANDTTAYLFGENVMFTSAAINVPGLTTILSQAVNSGSYYFAGVFRIKQGVNNNVVDNIGFSGPAATNVVWYQYNSIQGVAGMSAAGVTGSLTTIGPGGTTPAGQEMYIFYEGTVTFTASGTFAMIANISTTAFTVQPGTIFRVRKSS